MIKIVIISDTHNKFKDIVIPSCDILISAGDYSFKGRAKEVKKFHRWLNDQDAAHKISVQGNHEVGVERDFGGSKMMAEEECPGVYFIDEGPVDVAGVKIWCSAITPWFHDWAWNRQRGELIKRHWDLIPDDTDVLITHGPPFGYGDYVAYSMTQVGCSDLLKRIREVNPAISAFGHIHQGYGIYAGGPTIYINASICNEAYEPVNNPIVVEFDVVSRKAAVINGPS